MKAIIVTLVMVETVSAQSYVEAIIAAKAQNKPIFLYFSANWCAPCKKMRLETIQNEKVKKVFKQFIVLTLDYDEKKKLADQFSVKELPAYFVLDDNGKVLQKAVGYKTTAAFKEWLLPIDFQVRINNHEERTLLCSGCTAYVDYCVGSASQ